MDMFGWCAYHFLMFAYGVIALVSNVCSGSKDEDLRVPPSPSAHNGWNTFKKANPNDFYTPNKSAPRRRSGK